MSTHNICFHGEIRKLLYGYLSLSEAVLNCDISMRRAITEAK